MRRTTVLSVVGAFALLSLLATGARAQTSSPRGHVAAEADAIKALTRYLPPHALFGPAQIQMFRGCWTAHRGDNQAVGECVAQGLARQWADYTVGRPTRECIENPDHCTAGRLVTNPKKQIEIWEGRVKASLDKRKAELNELVAVAKDPKPQLESWKKALDGDVKRWRGDLDEILHRAGNPKAELAALERGARAELDAAARDAEAAWNQAVAKVEAATKPVEEELARFRKRVLAEFDRLQDENLLPKDFRISIADKARREAIVEAEKTVQEAARAYAELMRQRERDLKALRDHAVAEGKREAQRLAEEVRRLKEQELLPKEFNLNLPEGTTLESVKGAWEAVKRAAESYVNVKERHEKIAREYKRMQERAEQAAKEYERKLREAREKVQAEAQRFGSQVAREFQRFRKHF